MSCSGAVPLGRSGAVNPIDSWTCDTCGEQIVGADAGNVVFDTTDDPHRCSNFRIVHRVTERPSCDPPGTEYLMLVNLVGAGGLSNLLSWLSPGPIIRSSSPGASAPQIEVDLDEFVDLIRRIHVPHYDAARLRFADEDVLAEMSDANETYPYIPHVLAHIAQTPPPR